jgi:hypothetical protein
MLTASDKADWDSYANTLRGQFRSIKDPKFRHVVAFLKSQPPRKQIVEPGGGLGWVDTVHGTGESDERFVIRLVTTIRNNLFHGGKFPTTHNTEVARNRRLLGAGIIVMNQCLELSASVKTMFTSR